MPYQNAPSQDADKVRPNLGFGRPQAALPSSPSSWMLTCGAVAKILGCIFLGASICSDLWALNVTVGISYAQQNINSASTQNHPYSTSPWSIPGYHIFPQGSTMVKSIVNRMITILA